MNDQDGHAIWCKLAEIEAAYWYDVDNNWGRSAHEFYTEDGIFDLGLGTNTRYVGPEKVRRFYSWREGRGERTARHLMSNFQIKLNNAQSVSVLYVMSLFAEDGPPVRESKPAILVADVANEMVLCPDEQWRAKSRILKPIFMGGVAPTMLEND